MKKSGDNPILGIPQYQGTTTSSNLQSIQELHSENLKYEHGAKPAHSRLNSESNLL